MAQQAQVLVYETGHVPDDWRRFLAILCFIEFWASINEDGLRFWYSLRLPTWISSQYQIAWLISAGAGVCRALCFWALGRALWRGRTRFWRPILGIAAWSALAVWASELPRLIDLRPLNPGEDRGTNWWGILVSLRSTPFLYRALGIAPDVLRHLPWLFVAGWAVVPRRSWPEGSRCPWVTLAAVWSFALAFAGLISGGWGHGNLVRVLGHICPLDFYSLQGVCSVVLPAACGLWVLVFRRRLWPIPLLIAAINSLEIASFGVYWVPQVICADGSLRYLFNQRAFWSLFVGTVQVAGPWLLIALWAKYYPTRVLAGDGSPFPRRFCGKCHYNLHGIDSTRCPECGAMLATLELESTLGFSAPGRSSASTSRSCGR